MRIEEIKEKIIKIHNIINSEINLIDEKDVIIHSSNRNRIGESISLDEINKSRTRFKIDNYTYIKLNLKYGNKIYISIKGNDEEIEKYLKIISIFININNETTKEDFLKDLILGNIDDKDFLRLCNKYRLNIEKDYQIITIRDNKNQYNEILNLLKEIYPYDLIFNVDENLVFIMNEDYEYSNLAEQIYNVVMSELLVEIEIGIGSKVNILNLRKSYEEAILSITLGSKFLNHKKIFNYNDLVIPLLIKNMDTKLLNEILSNINNNIKHIFDDIELYTTAMYFLENNLNISESARKLYIHRNTLNYRLNKILNITGYDLRKFDDAINFKTINFIYNYLNNKKIMTF